MIRAPSFFMRSPMQPIGGIMKKLSSLGSFIPVLLIMSLIILCLPLTAYGQTATVPRDWTKPYTGPVTLSWKEDVPGSRTNALFFIEKGSRLYLGDLAATGVKGVSARQLGDETYLSTFPRILSIAGKSGLLTAKKTGCSTVSIHAGDQTITALITVLPKGSCALTGEGRKYNAALFRDSSSFTGKVSPSTCIAWYQKALKAKERLSALADHRLNSLGFSKSSLLVLPGAPSADALFQTMNAYALDARPLRNSSSNCFLPESLSANVKKNTLTLRLNSTVNQRHLLGLMTDPSALRSSPAKVTKRKTWTLPVLVYDLSDVNAFGEGKAYPAEANISCGSRLVTVRFTDKGTHLIRGHHYLLSDDRLSQAESVGGWTAGADCIAPSR